MSDKLTDEEFLAEIDQLRGTVSEYQLGSSSLEDVRNQATYEYAGMAIGHLQAQGVSTIVDTSTTEVVDGYTAIISELLFDNNKIARFKPSSLDPKVASDTKKAEDLTNHEIFTANEGWLKLNSWAKAGLLWKNSIIRWDWCEDYCYEYEEYDEIDEDTLDQILGDDNVELIGDLIAEDNAVEGEEGVEYSVVYRDVKVKRKEDKSGVRFDVVPHENFSIDRNAKSLDDFSYIGIEEDDISKSDLRKRHPDVFTKKFNKWEDLDGGFYRHHAERTARKDVTGETYNSNLDKKLSNLDENTTFLVTECWLFADRDGDGIAEMRHVIFSGDMLILDEYADQVNLASLCPIEIPYEFYGLSMADITRSSTLTSTAILRGFVENVYLTNFSPRLADPNVVDFAALQNMKPKSIIPTVGNPTGSVQMLQPENIAPGTVPLLQQMQINKEQANGLSKAAQGLNDDLYVSGNSEAKLAKVQSAAQTRIQHVARRFVQTGIKRFVKGVYNEIRKNASGSRGYLDRDGIYSEVAMLDLPKSIHIDVEANLGENSNDNLRMKYEMVGGIIARLAEGGRGVVIKETADAKLASMAIVALDLDPMDFIEDYNSPDFEQKAQEAREMANAAENRRLKMEELKINYDILAKEANARLLATQADNAMQDNAKQLAVTMDTHYQNWAELAIKADKEGTPRPTPPVIESLIKAAYELIGNYGPSNASGIQGRLKELSMQHSEGAIQNVESQQQKEQMEQ
jgi:hypothetical protein